MKKIVLVLVVVLLCVLLFTACNNSKCSIVAKQSYSDQYTGASGTNYLVRLLYKESYFNAAITSNKGLKITIDYSNNSDPQIVTPYGSELSNIYNNNNASLGVQKNVFEPNSYVYFWVGSSSGASQIKIIVSVDDNTLDSYTLNLK